MSDTPDIDGIARTIAESVFAATRTKPRGRSNGRWDALF